MRKKKKRKTRQPCRPTKRVKTLPPAAEAANTALPAGTTKEPEEASAGLVPSTRRCLWPDDRPDPVTGQLRMLQYLAEIQLALGGTAAAMHYTGAPRFPDLSLCRWWLLTIHDSCLAARVEAILETGLMLCSLLEAVQDSGREPAAPAYGLYYRVDMRTYNVDRVETGPPAPDATLWKQTAWHTVHPDDQTAFLRTLSGLLREALRLITCVRRAGEPTRIELPEGRSPGTTGEG